MRYLNIPPGKRNKVIGLYNNGNKYNLEQMAKYAKLTIEEVQIVIDECIKTTEEANKIGHFEQIFIDNDKTSNFALHTENQAVKDAYWRMMYNYNSDIAE